MNLQPITGTPFYFTCFHCGVQSFSLPDAKADLDGPTFRAWYCGQCASTYTNIPVSDTQKIESND